MSGFLIFAFCYLAIGALCGLYFEERLYRRSSEAYRDPREYTASATALASLPVPANQIQKTKCGFCKGTGENLAAPMNAGQCDFCKGTGNTTATNSDSDGLLRQEATPAALEAATDRIRRTCIGPLASGESPASLLPSDTNAAEYVIRKRGYFYRPESKGYTALLHEAGRWTKLDAEHIRSGRENVSVHHVTEFPAPPSEHVAEPVAFADCEGLERPIDASALAILKQNPTVKTYTDRFLIPLYGHPAPKQSADTPDYGGAGAVSTLPAEQVAVGQDLLNMLILCGELGGKQPNETYVVYLRRLIDAVIDAQTTTWRSDIENARYLIWSNEHKAWWRANSKGYTSRVSKAGRYSRSEAIAISKGRGGWADDSPPDEIAVSEFDIHVTPTRSASR